VLVTGSGGLIGSILRAGLSDEYDVRGLDVARGPGTDWAVDMKRARRIQPAFEGVSAVIDLAGDSNPSLSWEKALANNIPVTLNALEAARQAGVRRVVYASSSRVVGMFERDEPYASIVGGSYHGLNPETVPRLGADAPIRPDGAYAAGKAFGEAAARFYAEEHELSVICLRIGSVNREDRPMNARHFATLLTYRDLVELVTCCLAAPESVRFGIFYGVSGNTWRLWEIDSARDVLGYRPRDNAESWR
jgi:nucleoside-diphosphate-sugar epimerase